MHYLAKQQKATVSINMDGERDSVIVKLAFVFSLLSFAMCICVLYRLQCDSKEQAAGKPLFGRIIDRYSREAEPHEGESPESKNTRIDQTVRDQHETQRKRRSIRHSVSTINEKLYLKRSSAKHFRIFN